MELLQKCLSLPLLNQSILLFSMFAMLNSVKFGVLTLTHYLQVVNIVVFLISINMMDNFSFFKFSTNISFHNYSMDSSTSSRMEYIPSAVVGYTTLPLIVMGA